MNAYHVTIAVDGQDRRMYRVRGVRMSVAILRALEADERLQKAGPLLGEEVGVTAVKMRGHAPGLEGGPAVVRLVPKKAGG